MSVELANYAPFASEVAAGTGLNFYTVLGWIGAEGGAPGNPLNLDRFRHPSYGSQHAAADAVVKNLNTRLYADLEAVARRDFGSQDAELTAEARAIAASPWNNPNEKGSASAAQYDRNIRAGALNAIYTGVKPGTVPDPAAPGGFKDTTPEGGVAGVFDSIGGAVGSIGSALAWITSAENWKRTGLALLGGALVVVGLRAALA